LQSIEDGTIVASGHFNAEGSGNKTEVKKAQVRLLVPGHGIGLEKANDLGLICELLGGVATIHAVFLGPVY
jgi:hypothetical protein